MTVALIAGLIVLGLMLVVIEVIVLPGVGLVGLLGLASLVGAGVLAYENLDPAWSATTITASLVGAGALFPWLPRTRLGRAMVLEHEHTDQADNPSLRLGELVGKAGRSVTPLRPSGTADIGGRTVDVITDGRYVEPDTEIVVVDVRGSRVEVEPAESPES